MAANPGGITARFPFGEIFVLSNLFNLVTDDNSKRYMQWSGSNIVYKSMVLPAQYLVICVRIGTKICIHYRDVIVDAMPSQITHVSIAYSTVCSNADQRKYQSTASLAFVRGIHRWQVYSTHNGPVTRKMFPFDDVIMIRQCRVSGIAKSVLLFTSMDIWKVHCVLLSFV